MKLDTKHIFSTVNRFPTSKRDYTLITPMMKDVYEVIINELDKMETGVGIISMSRIGKTRALRYVIGRIKKEFPTLPFLNLIMTESASGSDKRFFKHVLSSATEVSINEDDDADSLRRSIVRLFIARCAQTQDPRAVLFIDEANKLTVSTFSYLMDLTNELEEFSLIPTVVLVGGPQLAAYKDQIAKKNKRPDIVGRFLDNLIPYDPVAQQDTLASILSQYDDYLIAAFPAGSQICIAAAYVPDLYQHGLRIANSSQAMWEAIVDTSSAMLYPPVMGMKSLTRAVEHALTDLAISEPANLEIIMDKNWWMTILHESGYLSHLGTIYPHQADKQDT